MPETPDPKPQEQPPPSAASDAPPTVDDKAEKKPKRTTGQKWTRRALVVIVTVLLIGLAIRIAVPILFPRVLSAVANSYGFEATYDNLDFYIFGGDVGLWNLKITPKGGAEPALQTQYCRGNISVIALLQGRLLVRRAEADAAVVTVERAADGSIPLMQRLQSAGKSIGTGSGGKQPIHLEPPLRIDVLRLQNAEAHFRDKSVEPTVDITISLSTLVNNIGNPDAKTHFSLDLNSASGTAPLLGALHVDGDGSSSPDRANADFTMRMLDLNLRPVEAYLSAFGITPEAKHISFTGRGTLAVQNNVAKADATTNPFIITPGEPTSVGGKTTQPTQKAQSTQSTQSTKSAATQAHASTSPIMPSVAPTTVPGTIATTLPATTQPGTLSARLTLSDMQLTADSQQAAAIDQIAFVASSIGGSNLKLAATVDGVRARAQRRPDGRPEFAGIAIGGKPAEGAPKLKSSTQPSTQTSASTQPSAMPAINLEALRINDVELTFIDNAVQGTSPLTLRVDELSLKDFDTRSNKPATLLIRGGAPGLAEAFAVDGTADVLSAIKTFNIAAKATGFAPSALDPYISAFGMQRTLTNATVGAQVAGKYQQMPGGDINASLNIKQLLLKQFGITLLDMDTVSIDDLFLGSGLSKIKIGKTRVEGPQLEVKRNADDTISALGYTFDPAAFGKSGGASATQPSMQPNATAGAEPTGFQLPVVEIDDFKWSNVAIKYTDEAAKPSVSFGLRDVTARIQNLTLDPQAPAGKTGTFNLVVSSPGNFDQFSINGSVTPVIRKPGDVPTQKPGEPGTDNRRLQFTVKGSGSGMHFTELAPVLESFGVMPVMKKGALSFGITGGIDQVGIAGSKTHPRSIEVGVKIGDLSLVDGETTWFKLRELGLDKAQYGGRIDTLADKYAGSGAATRPASLPLLNIDGFTIQDSLLKVTRDSEGHFLAAGFKVVPPKRKQPAATAPATQSTQPLAVPDTTLTLRLPFAAHLKNLDIGNTRVDWTDELVQPTARLMPQVDLKIDNTWLGIDKGPGEINMTLSLPNVVEQLTVRGRFKASPEELMAGVQVRAKKLTGGGLSAYLPGAQLDFKNGAAEAKIYVSTAPNPNGGTAAKLVLNDAKINGVGTGAPDLTLKKMALILDRFDLPAHVIAFDTFTVDGFTLNIRKDADALRIAGIAIGNLPKARDVRKTVEATTQTATEATAVVTPLTLDQLMAQADVLRPLFTLRELDINADRISYVGPGFAEPLAISDLHVTAESGTDDAGKPLPDIQLLGQHPQDLPPFWLTVTGKTGRLVDAIDVRTRVAPFAYEPSIRSFVKVTGIHGDELTMVVPNLKEYIAGSEMSNGTFTSNFDSDFNYTRRGLLGIDFNRDITANFSLSDIALKQQGNSKPLVGLASLRGERIRYSPSSKTLTAKSITIDTPTFQAIREKDGLHTMGFVFKLPEAEPAGQVVDTKNNAAPSKNVSPDERKPVPPPVTAPQIKDDNLIDTSGGIRVDSLIFSGIDLYLADRVGSPATIIPINELDGEVRGLGTRLLQYKERMSFNFLVGGGRIEVPKRKPVGGVVGILGDTAGLLTGKKADKSPRTEMRPVFSQAQANGNFSIVDPSQKAGPDERSPAFRPEGFIKFSLSGLELTAIRGLAKERGIDIGAGTFDVRGNVIMQGTRNLNAQIYTTFSDLSVSEPANGPIVRFLKLPFNLDTVIFALEDANQTINLPINVPIDAGKLDWDKIVGSIIGSVSRQIIDAVAAVPAKALTLGTNFIGLDFGGDKNKDLKPVTLNYGPGESQLTSEQIAKLASLIGRLKSDPALQVRLVHQLGSADADILQKRANPTPEEAGQLGYQLRQRKMQLQTRRGELAAQLRVAMASGDEKLGDDTQSALRNVSQQISATESAMDQTLDLLRPNSARQADRRTRKAGVDLGNIRLDTVREALLNSDVADIAGRIERVPPRGDPVEGQVQGQVAIVVTRQAKK